MSFYVILPSNASMDLHPDNKQTRYTTVLAKPIELNDNYEVAVVELSYSSMFHIPTIYYISIDNYLFKNKWSNLKIELEFDILTYRNNLNAVLIKNDLIDRIINKALLDEENSLKLYLSQNIVDNVNKIEDYFISYTQKNAEIDDWFEDYNTNVVYSNVGRSLANIPTKEAELIYLRGTNLVQLLNVYNVPKASTLFSLIDARYNDESKSWQFIDDILIDYRFGPIQHKIRKSILDSKDEELRRIEPLVKNMEFTFDTITKDLNFKLNNVNYSYKINSNLNSLYAYIYTDFIEPQYVGNTLSPCIKSLVLNKNDANIMVSSFDYPHYVRVNKNIINTILIDIRDTAAEPIKFSNINSQAIVKLHFRKVV